MNVARRRRLDPTRDALPINPTIISPRRVCNPSEVLDAERRRSLHALVKKLAFGAPPGDIIGEGRVCDVRGAASGTPYWASEEARAGSRHRHPAGDRRRAAARDDSGSAAHITDAPAIPVQLPPVLCPGAIGAGCHACSDHHAGAVERGVDHFSHP